MSKNSKQQYRTKKIELRYNGPLNAIDKDLPTLEKERDLALGRVNFASQQINYWKQEEYTRFKEYNNASIAWLKKKNGFTDEQIKDTAQSVATWAYVK